MLGLLLLEVDQRLGEMLLGGQVGEVQAQARDLGRGPAKEGLGTFGHEQEPSLRVAAIDDVRARLDELAEAHHREAPAG